MESITRDPWGADFDTDMYADVTEFEERLGLKKHFYWDLVYNDDWSFVIKLNALFEAACTHALSARLASPELLDVFAHLDFADPKKGKVKFLKSLGAITPQQSKILCSLATLRNDLVHNVNQVAFSMGDHFAAMDKGALKAQCAVWCHGLNDHMKFGEISVSKLDFFRENPKVSIWMTCMEILACLYLEFELAETRASSQSIRVFAETNGTSDSAGVGGGLLGSLLRPPG